MKSFDTILKTITLGQPRNSFERGILDAYNRCREEALERYLPMLDNRSIKVLLKDNYIQKMDVKNLLLGK